MVRDLRLNFVTVVSLAVVGLSVCLPTSASAVVTAKEIGNSVTKGTTYLEGLQVEATGELPSEWALTSLSAAGVAAASVNKSGVGGQDARSWYRGVIGAPNWAEGSAQPAAEFERATLAAYAAGIDPARPSSRQNLLAGVIGQYQPSSPGYYGATFSETAFALLALENAKTTEGAQRVPQGLLELTVEAVLSNRHVDGGWSTAIVAGNKEARATPSEPQITGAAMAALCSAGFESSSAPIQAAKEYLVSDFSKVTGAFLTGPSGEKTSDTISTAWAVSGLNACGINAQATEFVGVPTKKYTPLQYLITQQVTGGGYRLDIGTTANIEASAAAVRALAGAGFTKEPPTPASGPRWQATTEFATGKGEGVRLPLIVEDPGGPLQACSVWVVPRAPSTTLESVLAAGTLSSMPGECVAGYEISETTGAVTQVNGYPPMPDEEWKVSLDGGARESARGETAIHLGDVIVLSHE